MPHKALVQGEPCLMARQSSYMIHHAILHAAEATTGPKTWLGGNRKLVLECGTWASGPHQGEMSSGLFAII